MVPGGGKKSLEAKDSSQMKKQTILARKGKERGPLPTAPGTGPLSKGIMPKFLFTPTFVPGVKHRHYIPADSGRQEE